MTVALGSDADVRPLNARYREKDKPTNVLSFPAADGSGGGDVILARETVEAEADAQGKSFEAHAGHLIVHGILHLLGYDHLTPGEARRMERVERIALARLACPIPTPERDAGRERPGADTRG